jgi:hypothetical protein
MGTALRTVLSETRPWGREIGAEWDEPDDEGPRYPRKPAVAPKAAPKSVPSPTPAAKTALGASSSSARQTDVLRAAIAKRSDSALSAALDALQKDDSWVKSAGEDTLKKIRHALYQRGMKKEADMFRMESVGGTALSALLSEASEIDVVDLPSPQAKFVAAISKALKGVEPEIVFEGIHGYIVMFPRGGGRVFADVLNVLTDSKLLRWMEAGDQKLTVAM